ncbi:ubiquitin-conjugating enzyme E2 J2-like [Artibeus jamaicensis]|uniref:ubiquitin-conjugating enzyme E2 J2-like n=1 Tax=Artibeus jamaicensis TaxID=9417 RepID=UPI00235A7712|nr:ubiquitin-conjugating enzyme E2 J2-like [Artibeus jamaicensis]
MTPCEGDYYHRKLIFPGELPFKPPDIYRITPNEKFKGNTRLCLPFYCEFPLAHWSFPTIPTGLLSFTVAKGPILASVETLSFMKIQLAAHSLAFTLRDKVFCELFPEVVKETKQKQKPQGKLGSRPQALPQPDVVPDREQAAAQGLCAKAGPHTVGLQPASQCHSLPGWPAGAP